MASTYLDEAIRRLRSFEGSVQWMYLDTVGKVTVGVGLMLPSTAAAAALPFAKGDRPAKEDEIAAEFARVSSLTKGRPAKFYARAGGLRLSEQTIEQQLRDTLEGFESYLRKHVAQYEALPDSAKLALLDMVYNLGPGKLFAEYPRLIHAVETGDWKTAADASHRRGPGEARNGWTRQQFLSAAKGATADLKAAGETPVMRWLVAAGAACATVLLAFKAYEWSEQRRD